MKAKPPYSECPTHCDKCKGQNWRLIDRMEMRVLRPYKGRNCWLWLCQKCRAPAFPEGWEYRQGVFLTDLKMKMYAG